jgi:pimeloyl-[acyl-carrier protein] synthase
MNEYAPVSRSGHKPLADGAFDFNPLLPEFVADPYPIYYRLQAEDPVHWSPRVGAWLVSRYADVAAILQDKRFVKSGFVDLRMAALHIREEELELHPLLLMQRKWLMFLDPPHQTRIRMAFAQAFSPHVIHAMRTDIQEIVDKLIDKVQDRGILDLIGDFGHPLPVLVISRILGVPTTDSMEFKQWSQDISRTVDPILTDEILERANVAATAMTEYFQELLADRRKNPRQDLLTDLARAVGSENGLTEEEAVATCVALFVSGYETTVNLIGNGMLALLRHPDQLQLLRENPSLIQSAVEELLRYDCSVQQPSRRALEDVEIGGKVIRKNQRLFLLLGAANRDSTQFPNPDRLDITRKNNAHLAFGRGVHFCVGVWLARLEGQIAISTLLRRLPNLTLQTDTPAWRAASNWRGLKALPVSFAPQLRDNHLK